MILADTSVWIDHLRNKDEILSKHLNNENICIHPFVIGELACGNLKNRNEIINLMKALPGIQSASEEEVSHLIESRKLYGKGLGYIDMHLLASTILNNAVLWTKDKKLAMVYSRMTDLS